MRGEARVAEAVVGDVVPRVDAQRAPCPPAPFRQFLVADRPAAGRHPFAQAHVQPGQRHAATTPEPGTSAEAAQPAQPRVESRGAHRLALVERLGRALAVQAPAFQQADGETAVRERRGDGDAGRPGTDDADVRHVVVGGRRVEVIEDHSRLHAAAPAGAGAVQETGRDVGIGQRGGGVSRRATGGRYPAGSSRGNFMQRQTPSLHRVRR